MGIWSQQLDDSQLLTRLAELGPAIDESLARNDNTIEGVERLERIRTVLTFIGKRLDSVDPALLVTGNLQSVSGAISDATGHLRQFVSDGAGGHLTNANAAVDNAIIAFAGFLLPSSVEDLAGLRTSVTAYRNAMSHELHLWGNTTDAVRNKVTELDAKAEALEERIAEDQQRLQSAVDAVTAAADVARKETGDAFEALRASLREKGETELATLKAELDKERESQASAHNDAMKARQTYFDEHFEKAQVALRSTDSTWDQRLADAHTTHGAELSKLHTDYLEKAASIITTMEGQLQRVQELVGAIGDHGVTAGFKREADDARTEVKFWQRMALWSMVFLVSVGIATAFNPFKETLSWTSLVGRLYLSVATGVLAAYAANQANRYQHRERRNRKLELELRALGPFLEPVDKAEREKFRLKIAEVFFGQDDRAIEKPGPATPLELSKESLDKILDVAKTAIEKLPTK